MKCRGRSICPDFLLVIFGGPILLDPVSRVIVRMAAILLLSGLALAEDARVEGEVLVVFKEGIEQADAAEVLSRRELSVAQRYPRISRRAGRVATLVRDRNLGTNRLIARLKNEPGVEAVEPNYLRRIQSITADPDFARQWGLRNTGQRVNGVAGLAGSDTKFLEAWRLSRTTAAETVVAIIDTGIDLAHPDLRLNLWTNAAEIAGNGIDDDGNGYIDDVHGYDFANATGIVTDSSNHGTHLAGIIAATNGNGAGITGLQFRSKILPLAVSPDGTTMPTSAVISAIDYVLSLKERGANIVAVNASYGGASFSMSERNAIRALGNAGIMLVAAAGNDGVDNDSTPSYPANYDVSNVISVAALTPGNQLGGYSNYGATTVDLAAPGSDIYSTRPLSEAPSTTTLITESSGISTVPVEYSGTTATAGISGRLILCGIGLPSEFPADIGGNIALIERGTLTFAEKAANAAAAGAVAVVIYDNTSGTLTANPWTLAAPGDWIPVLRITQTSGQELVSLLPQNATVVHWIDVAAAYRFSTGTSMAVPHVSAAVAFAAMNFPGESISQRRSRILNRTTAVAALEGKVATGGRLDLLKMVDTDGDGLPDWWEMENFGTLAVSAADDPDGDGFSNADEFLAGSDPKSAMDRPGLRSFEIAPFQARLSFQSLPFRKYQVERSEDLSEVDWLPVGGIRDGDGSVITVEDGLDFAVSPRGFYRLRISPE